MTPGQQVYIAGPMTGYELYNFPAFDEARVRWIKAGYVVMSPADLTRDYWRSRFGEEFDPASTRPDIAAGGDIYREFLRNDVRVIADCDCIALLPGWEKSKGVALELTVARALGLAVYDAETMLPMQDGTKHTNPKDAIGCGKLPLELVPDSAIAVESLALLEGAVKYGRFNWRVAGVRASIYRAAALRHFAAWWNGEDADPKTGVPHLASVRACLAIIIDADVCGKLNDDRPPRAPIGDMVRALEQEVGRIKELFADASPHQHTIADSETNGRGHAERDT